MKITITGLLWSLCRILIPCSPTVIPTTNPLVMAQTLEKIFLHRVASVPQKEQEFVVAIPKNSHKKGAKLAALQGSIMSAHQEPSVSSVAHTAFHTPPPEITTAVLNIPTPPLISSLLLKSLHSAAPPDQPFAKKKGLKHRADTTTLTPAAMLVPGSPASTPRVLSLRQHGFPHVERKWLPH